MTLRAIEGCDHWCVVRPKLAPPLAGVLSYGWERTREVDVTVDLWESSALVRSEGEEFLGREDLVEQLRPPAVYAREAPLNRDGRGQVEEPGVVAAVGLVKAARAEFTPGRSRQEQRGLCFGHIVEVAEQEQRCAIGALQQPI